MNIAIVTVYQPFTNLGSFLQAFAMQNVLKDLGHNVTFIPTCSHIKAVTDLVFRINPKREFFLRFQKAWHSIADLSKLNYISPKEVQQKIDLIIYGSDEIWNITNPFFNNPIFWGVGFRNTAKMGYAVSIGHATKDNLEDHYSLVSNLNELKHIFTRDNYTQNTLSDALNILTEKVIDPTLLLDWGKIIQPIKKPKAKYLLVYTYGLDSLQIDMLKAFARERGLMIVSPFFWHIWVDKTIECSALQFGSLIQGAEYVFTSTFHGAIFSMINHSKCAILPVRNKVKEVSDLLGCANRLVTNNTTLSEFEAIISQPFPTELFEKKLQLLREDSLQKLQSAINNSFL